MTLILFPNEKTYVYDCNITDGNENRVRKYRNDVRWGFESIDKFICSHRDVDHIRCIKNLNKSFPIEKVLDSGVKWTTIDTVEYGEYIASLWWIGEEIITPQTCSNEGYTIIDWMQDSDNRFSGSDDQSVVMKIEDGEISVILTGDTSFSPWQKFILPFDNDSTIRCMVLPVSHHGSRSFFNDPSDSQTYYTDHIRKIVPRRTVVSVGPNLDDLPNTKALHLYRNHTDNGKICSTEQLGSPRFQFGRDGGFAWESVQ